MNANQLTPAVRYVIGLNGDSQRLSDELSNYDGKYGRIILAEALPSMSGKPAMLVRARIEEIGREMMAKLPADSETAADLATKNHKCT